MSSTKSGTTARVAPTRRNLSRRGCPCGSPYRAEQIRRTGSKLPRHCEGQRPVVTEGNACGAISCWILQFFTSVPGDCHVGLWPPRNDVVISTRSFFWWCGPDTPGGVSPCGSLRIGATLAVVPNPTIHGGGRPQADRPTFFLTFPIRHAIIYLTIKLIVK